MTINSSKTTWQYLEKRPHPWRQQLYFKGKKLKAFDVWMDMIVNKETPEDAAENWDLPLAAVIEAISYCEQNRQLLEQEAQSERRYLEEKGVVLEPKITH
jgi:uncharacterized protein (DUF433 family)